jgi:hypothetical protein
MLKKLQWKAWFISDKRLKNILSFQSAISDPFPASGNSLPVNETTVNSATWC